MKLFGDPALVDFEETTRVLNKTWIVEFDNNSSKRKEFTVLTEALNTFNNYKGHAVLYRGNGILLDVK